MALSRLDRRTFLLGTSGMTMMTSWPAWAVDTPNRTLIRSEATGIEQLNYLKSVAPWSEDIYRDCLLPLFELDHQLSLRPTAAVGYELGDDQTNYRVFLADIVWSDGVRVTADDYVIAMRARAEWARIGKGEGLTQKTRSIAGLQAYIDGDLASVDDIGIRAIDAQTLEIQIAKQDPEFPYAMSGLDFYPFPRHSPLDPMQIWASAEGFLANGPYVPVELKSFDYAVAERNQRYDTTDSIYFDKVIYKASSEGVNTEAGLVLNGEFDIYRIHDLDLVEWFRQNRPESLRTLVEPQVTYLNFNTKVPALSDRRIRQALVLALDRQFIAQELAASSYEVYTWTGGGNWIWAKDPEAGSAANFKYDPAKAQRIMEEVGYSSENPLRITLLYRDHRANESNIVAAIKAMWRPLGVDIKVVTNTTSDHYNAYIIPGNYDIALVSWVFDTPSLLDAFFPFTTQSRAGEGNYGGAGNAAVDEAFTKARIENDATKRLAYLRQIELENRDNVWSVPITHQLDYYIVSEQLQGFEDGRSVRPTSDQLWRKPPK
ncbi:ABC transporter substrate-binding protein [Palleronia caenipelagi]|uniref:Solute-binding protein family 5 domain-containing protein n=1 Tax=Palleronia caenipelagi TaxID=2489174 RepID=A0A547PLL0_9RHOB|nr:ABC transporter substrate-binding protein [Palleronia caenipelagi]TRD15030.1 hypothetical protein FEV53_17850 [Palleronia caenipelagi]